MKSDEIFTPSEQSGLLRGITRDLVIESAQAAGFSVIERDVDPRELWDADEVFITSSTRDIHPVTELAKLDLSGNVTDRRKLGSGLITEKLGSIFKSQRFENLNP